MSNITRDAREGKVEVRGIFKECAYYKKVCFMGGRGGGGGGVLNPVWAFD